MFFPFDKNTNTPSTKLLFQSNWVWFWQRSMDQRIYESVYLLLNINYVRHLQLVQPIFFFTMHIWNVSAIDALHAIIRLEKRWKASSIPNNIWTLLRFSFPIPTILVFLVLIFCSFSHRVRIDINSKHRNWRILYSNMHEIHKYLDLFVDGNEKMIYLWQKTDNNQ